MTQKIKQGSMRDTINKIYNKLIADEDLMRLLTYAPENRHTETPHPLSKDLSNIVDANRDEYWDIVDERVLTATKSTDIEEKSICRLYIYSGRRRPVFNNYLIVKQEVVIDVFVHESFDKDLRLNWICDRINEILALEEELAGLGRVEYAAGNSRVAPIGYSLYENVFLVSEGKK